MARIEKTLGSYLNQEAPKKPEAPKPQEQAAKPEASKPKPETNNDYVITLDIEGKSRKFREKAGAWANFKDNARAAISSLREKFTKLNKLENLNAPLAQEKAFEIKIDEAENEAQQIEIQRTQLAQIAEAANTGVPLEAQPKPQTKAEKTESEKPLSDIAEALYVYQPLSNKKENEALAQAFELGKPSSEQLSQAKKAFEMILEDLNKDPQANSQKIEWLTELQEILAGHSAEKETGNEKVKTYKRIAELIDIHQPLNIKQENQELAKIFDSGKPNREQLEQAGKALDVIVLKLGKDPIANDKKIEEALQAKKFLANLGKIKPMRRKTKETLDENITLKRAA